MDVELRSINDPEKKITVLTNHWTAVLKPQGQWEVVPKESREQPQREAEVVVKKTVKKRGKRTNSKS